MRLVALHGVRTTGATTQNRHVWRDDVPGSQVISSELMRWRIARLHDAGFDGVLAEQLAGDHRWDLHALLELVDRGCPPELAARILAPLEDQGPLR
jgi:hypothetical protein